MAGRQFSESTDEILSLRQVEGEEGKALWDRFLDAGG